MRDARATRLSQPVDGWAPDEADPPRGDVIPAPVYPVARLQPGPHGRVDVGAPPAGTPWWEADDGEADAPSGWAGHGAASGPGYDGYDPYGGAGLDATAVLPGGALETGDPYDYGRARLPEPEPEPLPEPTGLHLRERWETVKGWMAAASGLSETEPGLDRAFRLVECGLAAVYFWFGFLKLFPGVSPAEELVGRTVSLVTFHSVAPRTGVFALGLVEVTLAGLLWLYTGNRWVLGVIFAHLCATFAPFLLFPSLTFGRVPGTLSPIGQAVVTNLVLLGAVGALRQYHGHDGTGIRARLRGRFRR